MHGDAPASEAGLMRLLELPHHPHRRLLRGHGYWKRLGPGIVTGAADDDPSGIGTYSQVGAAFGFGLLWTTLATLPLAGAVAAGLRRRAGRRPRRLGRRPRPHRGAALPSRPGQPGGAARGLRHD